MSSFIDALMQSSATTSSTATQTKDKTTLGKEDFLSLLVAQMKNQDPLNPDDPTQFTAQLAQFSQLEQLFNMNDSMESLVAAYQGGENLTAIGTIGKEVAFASDTFTYDGGSAVLGYQLDEQATAVTLSLQKDGTTVATLPASEMTAGTHYLTWDGLNLSGTTAQTGTYSLVIDARNSDGTSITATPVVRDLVTGADLDEENGGKLLTGSGEIEFGNVLGVFDPAA